MREFALFSVVICCFISAGFGVFSGDGWFVVPLFLLVLVVTVFGIFKDFTRDC